MRKLFIATLLTVAACGAPGSGSLDEASAVEAQTVRVEIEQTRGALAELASTRPAELDDPGVFEPTRRAIRAAWKAEQVGLETKLVRLRLRLETLTGERLPPANLG